MIMRSYLQNPTREILVVVNTAVALTSLRQEVTIESGVRHGTGGFGLAILVNGGISAVFLLDRLALPEAPEKESSANHSTKSDNTNHHTGRDGRCVGPGIFLLVGSIGFTGCGHRRDSSITSFRRAGRLGTIAGRGGAGPVGLHVVALAGQIHGIRIATTA